MSWRRCSLHREKHEAYRCDQLPDESLRSLGAASRREFALIQWSDLGFIHNSHRFGCVIAVVMKDVEEAVTAPSRRSRRHEMCSLAQFKRANEQSDIILFNEGNHFYEQFNKVHSAGPI